MDDRAIPDVPFGFGASLAKINLILQFRMLCLYVAPNSRERTYIRSPGDRMTEGQETRLTT